jgi:putative glutamine amidotransferase
VSAPSAPLIGISAYSELARWGLWELPATVLPRNYVDQVAAAGGTPVLLPPVPGVQAAVSRLDGLIISGGPDIEPGRYGEQAGPWTTVVRPERDDAEIAIFRSALSARVPVLGICRGMQLMNVVLGGTLIQHLPEAVGHEEHSPTPGTMAEHEITVGGDGPGSRLAAILGSGTRSVPTHHHQGIGRLGAGLAATAWAEDGTIEAVELEPRDEQFAIGVQWHPETASDPALFRALVEAGRATRSR